MPRPVKRLISASPAVLILALCCGMPSIGSAATGATLFRLFLHDGSTIVSYGEYARLDNQVVFSMPVGGTDETRLHIVTLPAQAIDWPRTDRYAASARYQQYAVTRGEEDFQELSSEVASLLNQIALSTDRPRALELAEQARRTLAEWPRAHFGYRQQDVREITILLDESISDLRAATGKNAFELALVAFPDVELEPVLGLPSSREQLDATLRVAALTPGASERVALLNAALALADGIGPEMPAADRAKLRRTIETQIRDEANVDARYLALSQRILASASRAAAGARVGDAERLLNEVAERDDRLGRRRPEIVEALRVSVQGQLDAARRLQLLRDRWRARRSLYDEYHRSARTWLLQLTKLRPSLEAIRRLEGPSPGALLKLQTQLMGGADRLRRLPVPEPWEPVNALVVSAWRFAENAVRLRSTAVSSGNVATAWDASASASGALLMLERAQQEVRALLEPPRLQ